MVTQSAPRTLFVDTTAMETETDASASQELQETIVKVRSPFYGFFSSTTSKKQARSSLLKRYQQVTTMPLALKSN